MIQKLIGLIIGKDVGGRMFLTICCGLVFVYLNIVSKIDPKDSMAIMLMVFTLYFTRNDRTPTNGGTND